MPATLEGFRQAETALEKALAETTLPDGTPLAAKVKIGVGLPPTAPNLPTVGDEDDARASEMMRITIETPLADSTPVAVRDAVLDAFSKNRPLKTAVQFESDENHALVMGEWVKKFRQKGADIPLAYDEWIGFSDKAERPYDNTINIERRDGKYAFGGRVLGENVDTKQLIEDIKADMPEKMQLLAERIAKYKGVDKNDKEAMAAIKARVDDLDFEPTIQQQNPNGKPTIFIVSTIMTKKQKAALADPATANDKAAIEKLGEDNILNDLTPEQLGKTLGRMFLFGGSHAESMFPKVAGRKDMGIALAKSLSRLKKAKPELEAEINDFLNNDTFKSHYNHGTPQGEKPVLKSKPFVNKDPNTSGEMVIEFALPSGRAQEIVEQLAATPTTTDGKLAVTKAETAMGAAERIPAIAPAAIAAAEAAKKNPTAAGLGA